MSNRECDIVQDLLPLYYDNACSEVSSSFVEKHLAGCRDCQKIYDDLKEKIVKMFNIDELETKDPTYLNNSRSISILKRCLKSINDIEYGLKNNMPIDMIELDIKNIWEELGTINGTTYEEELLDEMFQRFCLGK